MISLSNTLSTLPLSDRAGKLIGINMFSLCQKCTANSLFESQIYWVGGSTSFGHFPKKSYFGGIRSSVRTKIKRLRKTSICNPTARPFCTSMCQHSILSITSPLRRLHFVNLKINFIRHEPNWSFSTFFLYRDGIFVHLPLGYSNIKNTIWDGGSTAP